MTTPKLMHLRGIARRTEAKESWKLAKSKLILLLTPLFWYFGWIQAYPGTYLATYFIIRSRALGSFNVRRRRHTGNLAGRHISRPPLGQETTNKSYCHLRHHRGCQ